MSTTAKQELLPTEALPYAFPTEPSRSSRHAEDLYQSRRLRGFSDELPRDEQYQVIQNAVGMTPVETVTINPEISVTTKQEWANLSGSHYDRALLPTLHYLETNGYIEPGDEIRDITSGSCGISLARLCNLLDYKARITVPSELPPSRVFPMTTYGAEVVSVGAGYVPAAANFQAAEIGRFRDDPNWEETRPPKDMASSFIFTNGERRICYLNHSENPLSPRLFSSIGTELVSQVTERPDALFLAAGNWTTIAGIAPVVREFWPDTQIIAYEGEEVDGPHTNFGTTVNGVRLKYKDLSLVDGVVQIADSDRDTMYETINPLRIPNRNFGHSSLMGLVAAQQMIETGGAQSAVTLVYDSHVRY